MVLRGMRGMGAGKDLLDLRQQRHRDEDAAVMHRWSAVHAELVARISPARTSRASFRRAF